jgi:anthranilate phosphoribosyltransferase
MSFLSYLHKVVDRQNLTAAEAQAAMQHILDGEVSSTAIAGFLVAVRMKGETPEEVLGFARAIRSRAVTLGRVVTDEPLVDTCGTGGDGACTFNISTVAAFVIAGAGVKVAKHGNRSISSQCGSADILEGLGVSIHLEPEMTARCIRETGIGFFFAPAVHPAMKHAQPARVDLKMRTVFNLLGPLTNPAGASVQLVGAPSVRAAELMAEALAALGLTRGFVVHGMDGLDEITTTNETLLLEIRGGAIAHRTVSPEDFGVSRVTPDALKGADRQTNVRIAQSVLAGEKGPGRDVVLVNAAAALVAAGRAADWKEGVQVAARAIDSGAATERLERLKSWTTSVAHSAAVPSR